MTTTNMVSEKPNRNATITMHSTVESNVKPNQRSKWMVWSIASIVLLSTIFGALVGAHLTMIFMKDTNVESGITASSIASTNGLLSYVSRIDWAAKPPVHELTVLETPVTRVIIAHTGTENCTTQASCKHLVKMIQQYHQQSRGWDDIGYNFLVGGDGAVYIARGWDSQGAHTLGQNRNSICIALTGTFNEVAPTSNQLRATQALIEDGVKLGKLTSDYNLYGHLQLRKTDSPGKELYKIIKTWDHWTDTNNN